MGPNTSRVHTQLLLLFFLSGATSLAYQTIFVKLTGYVFGNTTYAVSTVIAVFMGGLALGGYAFGRRLGGDVDGLRTYVLLELGIASYCAFVPIIFPLLEPLYVSLYRSYSLSFAQLTLLRFVLSAALILPPTLLMGGTLPALAKYVTARTDQIGRRVSELYAANTFGAAFGVFSVAYLFMPSLGLHGTLFLAVGVNVAISVMALRLGRGGEAPSPDAPPAGAPGELSPAPGRQVPAVSRLLALLGEEDRPSAAVAEAGGAPRGRLYALAFATGALAFGYEVTWTHVLSHTVGTSVYAFGIMLTTMLLGMAFGSRMVGRTIDARNKPEALLAAGQLLLGLSVFALLPLWDDVPKLFSLLGHFRPSFYRTEAVRFAASFLVMFVPAALLGVSFPLLIKLRATHLPGLPGALGAIYLANSLGCIAGSTVVGFFVLSRLGSEQTLRLLAALSVLTGLLSALAFPSTPPRFRLRLGMIALVSCALGLTVLPRWDLGQLNSGSHVLGVYNRSDDRILFYHEDVLGGVTSVVQGGGTRTLLTNGKFQGNDTSEMAAQKQQALIPMVFTHDFSRALVIGLGTGVTTHVVAAFPFQRVDVVEIAPGIALAADRFFGHVNENVLRDPRVKLHVTDGRNFLLLSDARFSVITIELSNVWFAGAANLYSRDFYELCRARLEPGGVLQQWVQLHHIDTVDLLSAMKTMHAVFPHMALFVGGGQGILLGSDRPLEVDYALASSLNALPAVQGSLRHADVAANDILSVLGGMYLYEENLSQTISLEPLAEVSTDWYPMLEYTTPKGNQLPYSLLANLHLLTLRRYDRLPRITNITPDRVTYLQGLLAFRAGNLPGALALLQSSIEQGNPDPACAALLAEVRRRLAAPAGAAPGG